LLQADRAGGEAERSGDTDVIQALIALTQTAGQGDHWHASGGSDASHAQRGFSVQGLCVQAAFAGDNQIRALHRLSQAGQFGNHLDARTKTGLEYRARGKPQAACGTHTGNLRMVFTQGSRHDLRIVGQRRVQLLDLSGAGAFLRAEHRRGAARAAQRVVDIRCHLHLNLLQASIQTRHINLRQLRQGGATGR